MFFGTEKSNRIHSTCVLHDIINSINMCLIELSEYTKFPFFSLLVSNPVCAGAEGGERWPGLGAGLQEARHPGDWRVKGGDSHNIRWLNRLCPPDTLTVVHLHRGLWTCTGLSIRYWLMVHLCQILSHVLAYTNSCLNPLLYAKMSRNFRLGFAQVDVLFWYVLICCNNWFRRHASYYNLLGR